MAWTASEESRSVLIAGLRNAHAMENQALSIMKPQVERLEHYPDVEQRLRAHIAETQTQIGRLDTILNDLGDDSSALKDAALSLSGAMAAVVHTFAPDEILKNSFANYAFENFESAAYTSLITLAEHGGLSTAVPLLQQSLGEERAMAEWLNTNLSAVTLRYVSLREAGQTAKK